MEKTILNILLEKFFRKDANPEEIQQLIQFFSKDAKSSELKELYEEKWRKATSLIDNEIQERIRKKVFDQINSVDKEPVITQPVFLWKKWVRIAAMFLLPVLFAWFAYVLMDNRAFSSSKELMVNVDIGQKANIQLPDGTRVWLNSATSVSYKSDYNKKDRIVHLTGEAYFVVTKDDKRPFIVKMDDLSVKALGTSFNVKAYPEDGCITTSLIEGKIEVSGPFEYTILMPNEKVVFDKQNFRLTKSAIFDVEKTGSWRNNQLAFEQESLEEIAKVLERMYNVKVTFSSDDLKAIHFSGRIKNNNLESVLQLISFVSPILYSIEDSTVIIEENPKEKNLYRKQ